MTKANENVSESEWQSVAELHLNGCYSSQLLALRRNEAAYITVWVGLPAPMNSMPTARARADHVELQNSRSAFCEIQTGPLSHSIHR